MGRGLAALFLAGVPAEVAEATGDAGALDEALAALAARGRAAHPGLGLSDQAFVAHVARAAELDPESQDLVGSLARLSDDLYLAAACVAGETAALAELDRSTTGPLRALVSSISGASAADDVLQRVREKLLVARPDRAPRLGDYGGRGALLTWLRVVAVREALSAGRAGRREVAVDDEVLYGRLLASQDPELALVRAQSARAIKAAFDRAVAALSTRERNLLRQSILDGLSIDDLGALYRVHRVTAARWLTSARERVWAGTQRALRAELALSPSQIESLLAGAREWLELSIERVLAEPPDPPDPA